MLAEELSKRDEVKVRPVLEVGPNKLLLHILFDGRTIDERHSQERGFFIFENLGRASFRGGAESEPRCLVRLFLISQTYTARSRPRGAPNLKEKEAADLVHERLTMW